MFDGGVGMDSESNARQAEKKGQLRREGGLKENVFQSAIKCSEPVLGL